MKALEEAQKKYWYGRGFNKWDSGCVANTELCVFAEGWKAALKLVKEKLKCDCPDCLDDFYQFIDEELNAKT